MLNWNFVKGNRHKSKFNVGWNDKGITIHIFVGIEFCKEYVLKQWLPNCVCWPTGAPWDVAITHCKKLCIKPAHKKYSDDSRALESAKLDHCFVFI